MVVRKRSGRAGGGVIEEQDGSFRVVNGVQVGLIELPQCQGAGAILGEYQVQPGDDNIAGPGISIGLGTKKFLSQSLSHYLQLYQNFRGCYIQSQTLECRGLYGLLVEMVVIS